MVSGGSAAPPLVLASPIATASLALGLDSLELKLPKPTSLALAARW